MQTKNNNNRSGIYSVGRIADGFAELIFREQIPGTVGIDGHMEIYRPPADPLRVLGVKVYSVDTEDRKDFYVCGGSSDNLIYWFQHSIPILIMVHDSSAGNGKVFWEHLREDNITFSESGWQINVPKSQEFNADTVRSIYEIPAYSPNLSRLAVDRPWMDMIESGKHRLFIIAEENINRPTGRGILKINIADPTGEKQHIYDWPFFIDPDLPFVYRFRELFPWAEITVDQDFYDEAEGKTGKTNSRAPLCAIRPWMIEAGEMAHFRLEMRMNDLGRAFLHADKYICDARYDKSKLEGSFGPLYEKGLKFKAAANKTDQ
ncbi:MAG: DUF4365 domain-containing protein [Synergistaceae bacterium]|nr:DUF4365 domain-containing protein [Synergistaceae bacterium]